MPKSRERSAVYMQHSCIVVHLILVYTNCLISDSVAQECCIYTALVSLVFGTVIPGLHPLALYFHCVFVVYLPANTILFAYGLAPSLLLLMII